MQHIQRYVYFQVVCQQEKELYFLQKAFAENHNVFKSSLDH